MKSLRAVNSPIALISIILIVLGCVCVAAAIAYETLSYPLHALGGSASEIELEDPEPPAIEYIRYEDVRSLPEDETGRREPDEYTILPGGEEPDEPEAVSDGEDTQEPTAPARTPSFVLLGTLKVPKLGISENLFEGAESQINYGLGHVAGTAMPGERGNSAVAGHRVHTSAKQPFRYLDMLENGDLITVSFDGEDFTYEVFDMFIVTKSDVWVLRPVAGETHVLTLVTCDPVVSAVSRTNRLIVRARITSTDQTLNS